MLTGQTCERKPAMDCCITSPDMTTISLPFIYHTLSALLLMHAFLRPRNQRLDCVGDFSNPPTLGVEAFRSHLLISKYPEIFDSWGFLGPRLVPAQPRLNPPPGLVVVPPGSSKTSTGSINRIFSFFLFRCCFLSPLGISWGRF